jgi:metallopeptidase YgjP-like protein
MGELLGAGRVTFDVDLLAQPESFRREVIVHELLHLRVPNHGPLFRALLQTYCPTLYVEPDTAGAVARGVSQSLEPARCPHR